MTRRHTCTHKLYGLSCDDYDRLRVRAGDRCEVCGVAAEEVQRRPLFIDHDHSLGQRNVRGLVCARCNTHLKYVDSGDRVPTTRERQYLAEAWHLSNPPPPPSEPPELILIRRAGRAVRRQEVATNSRDSAIREAIAGGHTVAELVRVTSLTKAQIERIVRTSNKAAHDTPSPDA